MIDKSFYFIYLFIYLFFLGYLVKIDLALSGFLANKRLQEIFDQPVLHISQPMHRDSVI